MNNMEKIWTFIQMEKSINMIIQQAKNDIVEEISATPIPGVEPLGNLCCAVKFSKLQHNIWTPEYYIPSVQAAYVMATLESTQTANSFMNKLKDMIDNKKVKIGQNVHPLNDTTVEILKRYYNCL